MKAPVTLIKGTVSYQEEVMVNVIQTGPPWRKILPVIRMMMRKKQKSGRNKVQISLDILKCL